jgi:hypothetical protein
LALAFGTKRASESAVLEHQTQEQIEYKFLILYSDHVDKHTGTNKQTKFWSKPLHEEHVAPAWTIDSRMEQHILDVYHVEAVHEV